MAGLVPALDIARGLSAARTVVIRDNAVGSGNIYTPFGESISLAEAEDWAIARRVGPTLKAKGLIFVGLDIIGDRLTEINVTSPTCVREIEAAFPISITGMLMDAIEARLQK